MIEICFSLLLTIERASVIEVLYKTAGCELAFQIVVYYSIECVVESHYDSIFKLTVYLMQRSCLNINVLYVMYFESGKRHVCVDECTQSIGLHSRVQ